MSKSELLGITGAELFTDWLPFLLLIQHCQRCRIGRMQSEVNECKHSHLQLPRCRFGLLCKIFCACFSHVFMTSSVFSFFYLYFCFNGQWSYLQGLPSCPMERIFYRLQALPDAQPTLQAHFVFYFFILFTFPFFLCLRHR